MKSNGDVIGLNFSIKPNISGKITLHSAEIKYLLHMHEAGAEVNKANCNLLHILYSLLLNKLFVIHYLELDTYKYC